MLHQSRVSNISHLMRTISLRDRPRTSSGMRTLGCLRDQRKQSDGTTNGWWCRRLLVQVSH
ncbi:hypothetical protein DACRYDRAFT_23237 [Dacryopinax primogenitus]|uniref:Uncharacterized protein n=1 Tax=Dacryopinax primogenitus (strain DJM 731) TaxID=1858805 RepID=M5FVI4_DACPD|nr:uncharacterized protein DACRYDRAFT_23237 [Dacryopinax primogenitus]EJU00309.1 hypothetical protein DACRYDRAFT_23237 [Dacryopinax primogenitus]